MDFFVSGCNMSKNSLDTLWLIAGEVVQNNPTIVPVITGCHATSKIPSHVLGPPLTTKGQPPITPATLPPPNSSPFTPSPALMMLLEEKESKPHPVTAAMLRLGLRQDIDSDRWYIDSENLILSSTDSISGDEVEQSVKEVTSSVGREIRDNLSKVFATSRLDIQQLDVVVTRRESDGVLICNVCIEAVDDCD